MKFYENYAEDVLNKKKQEEFRKQYLNEWCEPWWV